MQQFTGFEYLLIDLANNYGLDKLTWDERLEWARKSKIDSQDFLYKAENPALYAAGLKAIEKAKAGEPSGYGISLDATASGIQLLSCLIEEKSSALQCNVLNSGRREDCYTNVFTLMKFLLSQEGDLPRENVKKAVMTALYGSTATPKRVFTPVQLDTFYQAVETLMPEIWNLNKLFLNLWRSDIDIYQWTLPDNFHVKVKIKQPVIHTLKHGWDTYKIISQRQGPIEGGRSLGANLIHSIDGMVTRELVHRCGYEQKFIDDPEMREVLWNHYKKSGFLSVRILDYVDPSDQTTEIVALRNSLPKKKFSVLCVHDCFRVLPNNGNDLRRQYIQILSEIAKSDLLSYLMTQYLEEEVSFPKIDAGMHKEILNSEYALS